MKILMLCDKMDIGGAETHILTLCRALLARGHRITLFCAPGVYARTLQEAGVTLCDAPTDRRSLRGMLCCLWRLYKLRREVFDAVHAHTRYTAVLASLLFGGAFVTTAHLTFATSPLKRLLMRWGRASLAVSHDIADYLQAAYGYPAEQIFLTKNGIDQTELPTACGQDIVHVSRMDPDRADTAFALCRIAPTVLGTHPTRCMILVGDGKCFSALARAAAAANQSLGRPGVLAVGKSHSVGEYLRRGGVFVGVSRAALEGMAAGLPVILCGNEGYLGILDEQNFTRAAQTNFCARGEAGLTDEALQADLCALLEDPTRRQVLGRFLQQRVLSEYTPEAMATDAERAYHFAKRVLVLGYYGYGNLGDEMTRQALRMTLRARGLRQLCFTVKKKQGPEEVTRKNPFALARAIRRCDVLLLGGGNLLQNETSNRSLYYYGSAVRYAHHRRKSVVLWYGGIGDLTTPRAEAYVKRTLRLLRGGHVRTRGDLARLRALLGTRKVPFDACRDLCFALPTVRAQKKEDRVALILKGASPEEAVLALLARIRAAGLQVLWILLFEAEDGPWVRRLTRQSGACIRVPKDQQALCQWLAPCCLTISERLHGAVFSLLAGTPCALWAGSQKHRDMAADAAQYAQKQGIPPPLVCYEDPASIRLPAPQ